MSIKLVEDVGAPVAVAAVDIVSAAAKPEWNEWIMYGVTLAGYVGSQMNKGGNFLKNVGISAMPTALKLVYNRVKTMTGASARPSQAGRTYARVANYGSVASRGISDVVKPEFGGVGVL